jgi:hypothetical protein
LPCYLFNALKRSAAILLLSLILLQTGGYYIILYASILGARVDAADFIKDPDQIKEKAVTLTFPVKDGKLIATGLVFDDEDEFSYQGRMYDIISINKSKDHISFTCYSDTKETELDQNLCDKIDTDREAPAQKHKGFSLLKILLPYLNPAQSDKVHSCELASVGTIPAYTKSYRSFVFKPIISPPPELTLW